MLYDLLYERQQPRQAPCFPGADIALATEAENTTRIAAILAVIRPAIRPALYQWRRLEEGLAYSSAILVLTKGAPNLGGFPFTFWEVVIASKKDILLALKGEDGGLTITEKGGMTECDSTMRPFVQGLRGLW